jgi:hypothetical protein
MVTSQGLAAVRPVKKRWLPDTVGTVYQVFPVLYNNGIKYFVADAGKIKYITPVGSSWIDCGGDNVVTTIEGSPTTFLRIMDQVYIMNGEDRLGYVDLATNNVVRFTKVNDPTTVPTAALVGGLTGTPHKVYYAIWYSGIVGKTASTPIVTVGVSKIREQWATDGTQGVTITDPNTRPANARSWNLGLATAPAGGTIQLSDIVPIALGIDIATTSFTDNGKLPQILDSGTAPDTNSTEGPRAKYGREIDGRPFLYGIKDDPYAILIGGNGEYANDFTESNGGYRLVLNEGTNYYPQVVTGFRNGPGAPSTTVLYSNTEGLSKQSIIEPNTVSLGTFSSQVWGSTEQNYGAAGVSSPYAAVNSKGKLVFPTVEGILKLDTEASLQNVLLPQIISDPLVEDIGSIQTELLPQIVGTAWKNQILMSVPARGFDYNNLIAVLDTTNRERDTWYTYEINAQWIGTIAPAGSPGFVYVCEGNHLYRLEQGYVAEDDAPGGLTTPFPVELNTALVGANTAHNSYYAIVQGMFYLKDFIGTAELIVEWRDKNTGKMKRKKRTIRNGTAQNSTVGGWDSADYDFAPGAAADTWGDIAKLTDGQSATKKDVREPVPLQNVITNEIRGRVVLNPDRSSATIRSISFQGQPLGITPDVG